MQLAAAKPKSWALERGMAAALMSDTALVKKKKKASHGNHEAPPQQEQHMKEIREIITAWDSTLKSLVVPFFF